MHVLYIHVCHCIIVVFLLVVALAVRDPDEAGTPSIAIR